MLLSELNYMKKIFKKLNAGTEKTIKKNIFYTAFVILAILFVFVLLETANQIYFKEKISYNVFEFGKNFSGYTKSEYYNFLTGYFEGYNSISVKIGDSAYLINLSDINFTVDKEKNWQNIYREKKEYLKKFFTLSLLSFAKPAYVKPSASYDIQLLTDEIANIESASSTKPIFESVSIGDNSVIISPGQDGTSISKDILKNEIMNAIDYREKDIVVVPKIIYSSLSQIEKEKIISKAQKLIDKKILIVMDDKKFTLTDGDLISTLNDKEENKFENINALSEKIGDYFNQPAKDSVFVFESGKVTEFTPSEYGIDVNAKDLKDKIVNARDILATNSQSELEIVPAYAKTNPKVTTGDINNLGIKEKIGAGFRTFKGSAASRIHNIELASSRLNGVLISPGEILSFNKTLGDVSKVTGYQQAYIIQDGQTILGDGGGVCQVSTTFFRAALNAGMPIVERRAHSYRVSYYEQGFPPGLDATVFDPTTDLKIKNDTEKYILIQTIFDKKNNSLTFNLYGTSDGRVATVGKSVTSGTTPPPDDLYIDDPTLKAGVIKQIDYKSWGAKVFFSYKVEREGNVLFEKIFYSNYQPWQAKFLKGTGI